MNSLHLNHAKYKNTKQTKTKTTREVLTDHVHHVHLSFENIETTPLETAAEGQECCDDTQDKGNTRRNLTRQILHATIKRETLNLLIYLY